MANPRNVEWLHRILGLDEAHSNSMVAECRSGRCSCPLLTCSAGHLTSAAWHKTSASCTASNFVSNLKIGYSGLFHTELPTLSVPGIQSYFALALVHSSSQNRIVTEIAICITKAKNSVKCIHLDRPISGRWVLMGVFARCKPKVIIWKHIMKFLSDFIILENRRWYLCL